MKIKAINGFKDLLPEEVSLWREIETRSRDIFDRFGFREIRMPILEKTELFSRSIGEATDIVEKEMYTFTDKGITMRPEATASLLRCFIEHGMHVAQPVHRLWTMGPMFRHERPQKGRLRQFHQIDVEVIGAMEPRIDAELMAMGQMLLKELGLDVSLEINSLGCAECRPGFREKLVAYLDGVKERLCADCQRRTVTNPLRVLDCKKPDCKALAASAPSILDHLCAPCDEHFSEVRTHLDRLGVEFKTNRFMVRGLDYYTRTTFEFLTDDLGAQSAVGAGGRYDGLIKQLGGPELPGMGFAMGMERLTLLMQAKKLDRELRQKHDPDIYIAALGPAALDHGMTLVHGLRARGGRAAIDYGSRSLKAQMKLAGRLGARFVLIMGEAELEQGEAVLRDMQSHEQSPFTLTDDLEAQCARLLELTAGNND